MRGVANRIEVIPFGQASFAVIGKPTGSKQTEARFYRIDSTNGVDSIAEVRPPFASVNGACATPDGLALGHWDEDKTPCITFVDESGNAVRVRLPPGGNAKAGCILGTYPIGWHAGYGLLLGAHPESGGVLSATIRAVKHDAVKAIRDFPEFDRDIRYERAVSLRRSAADETNTFGRIALLSDQGVLVLGPGKTDVMRIAGAPPGKVSILGCRADGEVLIEIGRAIDGDWRRSDPTYEKPPFAEHANVRSGVIHITSDNWELSWEKGGDTLVGRQAAGPPDFWWNAADQHSKRVTIHDAIGTGSGRCWASTSRGTFRLKLGPVPVSEEQGPALKGEMRAASNELVAFEIDGDEGLSAGWRLADPKVRRSWRVPNAHDLKILQAGDGVSLIICCSEGYLRHCRQRRRRLGIGRRPYVYSRSLEKPVRVHHLRISEHTFALPADSANGGQVIRFLSVLRPRTSPRIVVNKLSIGADDQLIVKTEEVLGLNAPVCCCAAHRGHLAIGYWDEKVELRPFNDLKCILATAYLPAEPTSIAIADRPKDGVFLVAAIERGSRLLWYPCRKELFK